MRNTHCWLKRGEKKIGILYCVVGKPPFSNHTLHISNDHYVKRDFIQCLTWYMEIVLTF